MDWRLYDPVRIQLLKKNSGRGECSCTKQRLVVEKKNSRLYQARTKSINGTVRQTFRRLTVPREQYEDSQ